MCSSRGLGLEISRVALRHGHDVVATARDAAAVTRRLGPSNHLLAWPLDVTDSAAVDRAVAAAVDRFGTIDVLVNNAGRGLLGPMEASTDAQVRSLFDLDVFAVITLTRAVLPIMRAQRAGRIVTIGSRSGLGHNAGSSLYDATKHALEGLTGALALEVAPFGIQATIIEPGVFRTDFLDASSLVHTDASIPDYDDGPAGRVHLEWIAQNNHRQLGDPVRGAELIHQVATSPDMPPRLPMGRDAVEAIEARAAYDLENLAPWRDRSLATAVTGEPAPV